MVCGNIFKSLSIPNSQRAEILRECSSHTMSHVSRVTCPMSKKNFTFFFIKRRRKKYILTIRKKLTKWWSQSVKGLLSTGPTRSGFALVFVQRKATSALPLHTSMCPTWWCCPSWGWRSASAGRGCFLHLQKQEVRCQKKNILNQIRSHYIR